MILSKYIQFNIIICVSRCQFAGHSHSVCEISGRMQSQKRDAACNLLGLSTVGKNWTLPCFWQWTGMVWGCICKGSLPWLPIGNCDFEHFTLSPLLGRKFGQCMGILDAFGLVQIQLGPAENVAKRNYFQVFVTMGFLRRKKTLALRCSCRTNITVNHFDIWSPHLNLNEWLQVQCAPESHSVLPSIALAADTSSPDMMIQYCLCLTSWLCWP